MILKMIDDFIGSTFAGSSQVKPRMTLEATVYRACPKCGHSGLVNYKYHEDFCPQCGEKRPPIEKRGVIFDSHPWWQFKRKILRKLGFRV